jgi:hypothetical protein
LRLIEQFIERFIYRFIKRLNERLIEWLLIERLESHIESLNQFAAHRAADELHADWWRDLYCTVSCCHHLGT